MQGEGRPSEARPPELPPPDVLELPRPERLLERLIDQMGVEALGADEFGRGGVLGDFGAERLDAAAGLEDVAPPQHRLALSEAESEGLGRILPARLIGVEERALDVRPERLRPRTDRRRADDAGVGAPARQETLNVVGGHQHVGIGDDHPIVPRRLPALHDIVELGIGADPVVADQEPRGALGMGPDRAANEGSDRIVGAGEAEDDLVVRIVEREDRAQSLPPKSLDAAERLHDADGRRVFRRPGRAAAARATAHCERDGASMNHPARDADPGGQGADCHAVIVLVSRIGANDIAGPARRFYEGS